jgi:hypothetical protein
VLNFKASQILKHALNPRNGESAASASSGAEPTPNPVAGE